MAIITIPLAGQYGLVADQPQQELPINAWTKAENIRFRDGSAERVDGHVNIFSAPTVTPYFIAPYGTTTKRYWIHAGLTSVHSDDGTTRDDITGTAPTGGIDDRWTGGTLNGVFFLNNGVDDPMYWGGTGNLASVPGWDATWTCKSLGAYKNYLVAIGVSKGASDYPHMVKWSNAAEPGTMPTSWDETDPTIDAGEIDLAETPDLLVDQMVLGEVNIIYKEASMYSMQFVQGNDIFAFRRLPGNFGMLARGCGANTPKGHVVLAAGDLVLHQGQGEPQSLLTGKLKRWLFQTQIDSVNYKRCFLTANPTKNEVWICYPYQGASSCTKALIWNWQDNTFGTRDLPNVTYAASGLLDYTQGNTWADYSGVTWADLNKAWNGNDYTPADSRLILASTLPRLYLADARSTFAGTNIAATLERTGMAFDDPYSVKTIRAIYPRIKAVSGTQVYVQLGASMDAEIAPTWGDPVLYTVGTTFKADSFATGRFLALRVYSTGKQGWSVKSMDVDLVARGAY